MKALFKTLFGDASTIAVVVIVMAVELLLVDHGRAASAALVVPALVMAGAAWLARR